MITGNKLGLSPVLMASANSAGGVMGQMIDAQSIMVACAYWLTPWIPRGHRFL